MNDKERKMYLTHDAVSQISKDYKKHTNEERASWRARCDNYNKLRFEEYQHKETVDPVIGEMTIDLNANKVNKRSIFKVIRDLEMKKAKDARAKLPFEHRDKILEIEWKNLSQNQRNCYVVTARQYNKFLEKGTWYNLANLKTLVNSNSYHVLGKALY